MPRKQLKFDMSICGEETKADPEPQYLMFEDEDSCDSGFESHDSDTEMQPQSPGERRHSCKREPMSSVENQMNNDIMGHQECLIRDASQIYLLPTVQGKHSDLKSVSAYTVSQLIEGNFDDVISEYQIIDCRYPYEYEGGHIKGAINLHTEEMITDFLTKRYNTGSSRSILIFHCEFSSKRGPKLLRHLRNMDRKVNSERYPALCYPDVYLIDGGYDAFYHLHQTKCEPRNYIPMQEEDYFTQTRHFRVKSKSWSADERQNIRKRRNRLDFSL